MGSPRAKIARTRNVHRLGRKLFWCFVVAPGAKSFRSRAARGSKVHSCPPQAGKNRRLCILPAVGADKIGGFALCGRRSQGMPAAGAEKKGTCPLCRRSHSVPMPAVGAERIVGGFRGSSFNLVGGVKKNVIRKPVRNVFEI